MTDVELDRATSTEPVVALVRRWLAEAAEHPVDPAAARLAGVLGDPDGLAFTVGFVDGVMRPDDVRVAARHLARVAGLAPRFLPRRLRAAIRVGGFLAPALPWAVVPIARRALRTMVGHLVLDATPAKLGAAIARLRADGDRLNLNLLGEAVLGDGEARRRLDGTKRFLARDDVDYVSIKVSSIAPQLSLWAFDESVDAVVAELAPLYELAAAAPEPKFINLDMEEYRDLDLTIAVFTRLLDRPRLRGLEAGIVLQSYLPDALGAMQRLQEWAAARRSAGGAPVKVRLVKGANLAMEHVDAELHGWPLASYDRKQDTDTNYKRVLDWAMTPERLANVRLGVAGHNLFDIAHAWLTATARGVAHDVEFEMLLGMAAGQAAAVRRDVGRLLLYTPVVDPREFDVAIAYLVRRLEENASSEHFLSAAFELATVPASFERERDRFLASLEALDVDAPAPRPNRIQDRRTEWDAETVEAAITRPAAEAPVLRDDEESLTNVVLGLTRGSDAAGLTGPLSTGSPARAPLPDDAGPGATPGFANEPDTDPALAANRDWGRRILARAPESRLGIEAIAAARVDDGDALDAVLAGVASAGARWGARPAAERAAVLHRAGLALAANRDRLIEVMVAETGKTIAEADPEVSEAIDFAHYYAERARELDVVRGAAFVPAALTLVAPPWNFPVAIPAGGVLAALAAGSGVVVKPAPQAKRCGAVVVEALWEAGVPRELLALVDVEEGELGGRLVADPRVERVILTGSYETARLFRTFRADLPLLAETSGKNAIVVTPSADFDLAAADVVRSAFGHAGQKCSAASLVILVGSVADSKRFERQLVDATRSLRAGPAAQPSSRLGPLIEPAAGKLEWALTTLDAGERWLVEPRPLDGTDRLWSPGIRTGVAPGSRFHLTEFFGPVLGVMRAKDLDEAIALQNAVDFGLTAGIHTLDPAELAVWLDRVEAGNLYVNRGVTGAIVGRQPFGGWKRSAVGPGAKAGGPNYLFGLGEWMPVRGGSGRSLHLRGLERRVTDLIEASQSSLDYAAFESLRQSALSDELAWIEEYGRTRELGGLAAERNLFRYRPVPVTVRIGEGARLVDGLRVLAAGLLAKAPLAVSSAHELPKGVRAILEVRDVPLTAEADAAWLGRLAAGGLGTDRIRLVAGDAGEVARAVGGRPEVAVWSHPVTTAGRVELLPFLHEQSISITNHRFGTPTDLSAPLT